MVLALIDLFTATAELGSPLALTLDSCCPFDRPLEEHFRVRAIEERKNLQQKGRCSSMEVDNEFKTTHDTLSLAVSFRCTLAELPGRIH